MVRKLMLTPGGQLSPDYHSWIHRAVNLLEITLPVTVPPSIGLTKKRLGQFTVLEIFPVDHQDRTSEVGRYFDTSRAR